MTAAQCVPPAAAERAVPVPARIPLSSSLRGSRAFLLPAGIQAAPPSSSQAGSARGGSLDSAPRPETEAPMEDWPITIRMQAFAVAMAARAGRLTRADLDELEAAARELEPGNQLRLACEGFVAQAREALRDRARLADLGRDLGDYVTSLLLTRPPDLDRRDIHG